MHERALFHKNPFGGYATPTKCEAFWRLALNSNNKFTLIALKIHTMSKNKKFIKFRERILIFPLRNAKVFTKLTENGGNANEH